MKSQPVYLSLKPKKSYPFRAELRIKSTPWDERETRVTGNKAQIFMERDVWIQGMLFMVM